MEIKDFVQWLDNEWRNTAPTKDIERLKDLTTAWDILLEYIQYMQDKADKINADCKD